MEKFSLIAKALEYAAINHRGFKRKASDTPYIVNQVEAAIILQKN